MLYHGALKHKRAARYPSPGSSSSSTRLNRSGEVTHVDKYSEMTTNGKVPGPLTVRQTE